MPSDPRWAGQTRICASEPADPRGSAKNPQLGCSPAFPSKSINSDLIKWRNYFQELKNIQSVLSTLKGQTLCKAGFG